VLAAAHWPRSARSSTGADGLLVGAALVLGLWAVSRDASRRERRARAELPDTIRLPDGRD
jgi:hypothetical protein